MGDADVGVSSLESGDAGSLAASRALMEGGSLPPRKRLLAGLKQNGWLATSPPPVVSAAVGGGGELVVRKYEDGGCMGCNAAESSGMRRIKRGGVSLRLCSACTLLYSKSMFCPHCLAMYHDASLLGDPSMWLVCTRCRRSVHPECEQKHAGSAPDPASYVCLDCVTSARRQREANGVTGMRSKHHSSARPVPGFHGEARAGVGGDFLSPALKKPRMGRERSSRPGEHDGSRHRDGGRGGGLVPPRKPSSMQPPAESASPQEAAAAARNAANAAAKVAAAAKVNAAAKAAASVRAAAVAKAALEAAAHASRADAAVRAELRKKLASGEARAGGGAPMRLEINVHSEPRRERSSKGEMKYERDDGFVPRRSGPGSVADEELARQLHRVINSSPRISRSMTPMRRKASVKPETPSSGVSNSSADIVRVRPRPSPAEPAQVRHEQQHHLHPQTRPRSITHKEFRRIDSRVSRHEVKPAEEANAQQVPPSEEAPPSDAAVDLASGVKSEAMDAVIFAPVGVQDEASILFEALVEGESMHAAGEGGQGHGRRPDYLQEILEAAVLTDSAMFHDGTHDVVSDMETLRPEPEGQETLVASGLEEDATARDGDAGEDVSLEAATLGLQDSMEAFRLEPDMAEQAQETLVASGSDEDAKARDGDVGGDVSLELQDDNQLTVLHDVEMEDAPPVVEEDPTGMMEPTSEERPSGEPVEENMMGAEIVTEAVASEETIAVADTRTDPIDTRMDFKPDATNETVTVADSRIEPMDTSIDLKPDMSNEDMTNSELKPDASNEVTSLQLRPDASNETVAVADTTFELMPDASNKTVAVADTSVESMPDANTGTTAVVDTSMEPQPDASNETMAVGADTSFVAKPDVSSEIIAVANASIESQLDASNESVTVGADTSIVTKPDVSFEIMAVADASIEPQPDASNETVAVGADTSIVAKPDVSNETVAVGADTSIVAKPDVSSKTLAVADGRIEPQPDASNETVAVGADTSIVAKPDVSSETMAVSIEPQPGASNETVAVGADTSIVAKPDVSSETLAVADGRIEPQPDASSETTVAVVADTSVVAKLNEMMAVADANEVSLRNAGTAKVAKSIADAILAGANLTSLVEVGGERTASRGAAMGSSTAEQSG